MVALFAFMGIWNDFLSPLMYLQRPEQTTLAPGLQIFLIPARLDALGFPHGVQCAGHPAVWSCSSSRCKPSSKAPQRLV